MRAAALVLLATFALVVAGCGSGGGSSLTPLELVANATSKTAKADSAKFHMTIAETVGPIGPLSITADGTSSNATHSARMTMDLSSVAQLAGGDPSGWKGDVIVDGTNPKAVVEYMRLPALAKLVPGAKAWVKIDVSELSKLHGVDLEQLIQTAGTGQDPTQALQMLQSVGNVKEAGSEQVDGVDTTKYSGTLDPQKLAKKFGRGQFGQIFRQMGTTQIPVTVWVDGDGYVRKLEESMNAKTAAGAMTVKLAVELSDFGATVDVTPPPSDQTTDISQLLKKK